ncbi:transcriptional regulator [Levilactobacillus koreensis JCM 16448]|uniref:Transcriptional regulator n=1 Tax=Levilactobacillus koreensis TaxID=637971 RepID=A0AAC8UXN9_9LACO|nr:TetR/AcrR family transcriptional regulator [Levilactobacillus koreensis]AKP65813.1 transcriptional regulator [Levilactobacillus koreensis]KRK87215.1 transcriptional regulator [Levilactobacillus koreensis JCM 16448]
MAKQPYHRKNLAAAIQQQARQQLEEAGVDQLSLRQIARFLAVTPAAVYRHFPDKASLLAALRVEFQEELAAALREGVLDSPNATAMLQRMVTNLLTYARNHPQATVFLLQTPVPAPQSLQTVVALLAAQQPGTLPVEQAAPAIWTFLLGTLLQLPTQPATAEEVTAQLMRLLRA